MDIRQQAIQFIKTTGPIIPVKLAKEINSEILIASAHLAELSARGIVKVSHLKIGGSPLYFLPDQKEQLQNFSNNLNEKERQAYDLLKQKKVLREHNLEPAIQVAIKSIKDFAVPLNVTFANNKETFWKWYLLSEQEARPRINEYLAKLPQKEQINTLPQKNQEEIPPQHKPEHERFRQEQQRREREKLEQERVKREQELRKQLEQESIKKQEQLKQEQQLREAELLNQQQELKQQLERQEQRKQQEQEQINRERQAFLEEKKRFEQEKQKIEQQKEALKKQEAVKQQNTAAPEEQQKLAQQIMVKKETKDLFFDEAQVFFNSKKIKILSCEITKKNKELDLMIAVPSPVGELIYYCKAKNKKKVSDSDISSAFVQGQLKKLPVLFISKGDLTKKAQGMLDKEFKGISINKI